MIKWPTWFVSFTFIQKMFQKRQKHPFTCIFYDTIPILIVSLCPGECVLFYFNIFITTNPKKFSLPVVLLSTARNNFSPSKKIRNTRNDGSKPLLALFVLDLCFVSIIWRHWFRIHVLNKRPHRFSNWQRIFPIFFCV